MRQTTGRMITAPQDTSGSADATHHCRACASCGQRYRVLVGEVRAQAAGVPIFDQCRGCRPTRRAMHERAAMPNRARLQGGRNAS